MNDTGIIWTEASWNPMSGCQVVTPGCDYCYAKTLAENKRGGAAFPVGFDLTLRPHKLIEPKRIKVPTLIFVNSMSDMFWEQITDEYRDRMVDVMLACPQHEFQVLTKRPAEMVRYFTRRAVPPNMWCGVTVEAQRYLEPRTDLLRQVNASIRFISAEPLLTPLDFDQGRLLDGIDWIITGGESGTHLCDPQIARKRGLAVRENGKWIPRPERVDWIRSIDAQCRHLGVKHFFKQWGGQYPKSAGRLLDGKTRDEFPRLPGEKTEITNQHLERIV